MTGTLVSRPTRMRAWLTDSQMYSKCMVLPLSKTPMGMMASNGLRAAGAAEDEDAGAGESKREVAVGPMSSVFWIWLPAMRLIQTWTVKAGIQYAAHALKSERADSPLTSER